MASRGYLTQKQARLKASYAKARKHHKAGAAQLARALTQTTTALLRDEVNHARIAPAQRANAARKADAQPSLF